MTAAAPGTILHASCVAVGGRAVLITGASGAGKSSLSLRLIALGAQLISDDRTLVVPQGARLVARCPAPALRGLIEARGVGILRADSLDEAALALVVDLDQTEDQRLPPHRSLMILGHPLPLVLNVPNDHFPSALMLYLRGERQD